MRRRFRIVPVMTVVDTVSWSVVVVVFVTVRGVGVVTDNYGVRCAGGQQHCSCDNDYCK